jgi:hypothetical protein
MRILYNVQYSAHILYTNTVNYTIAHAVQCSAHAVQCALYILYIAYTRPYFCINILLILWSAYKVMCYARVSAVHMLHMMSSAHDEQCTWWAVHMMSSAHDEQCTWWAVHMMSSAHDEQCTWWAVHLMSSAHAAHAVQWKCEYALHIRYKYNKHTRKCTVHAVQCKVHTVLSRNTVECAHCAVQILRGVQTYTVEWICILLIKRWKVVLQNKKVSLSLSITACNHGKN